MFKVSESYKSEMVNVNRIKRSFKCCMCDEGGEGFEVTVIYRIAIWFFNCLGHETFLRIVLMFKFILTQV